LTPNFVADLFGGGSTARDSIAAREATRSEQVAKDATTQLWFDKR